MNETYVTIRNDRYEVPDNDDFESWWYNEGSGIIPIPGDDMENHAKRVAAIAWNNCVRRMRYHL